MVFRMDNCYIEHISIYNRSFDSQGLFTGGKKMSSDYDRDIDQSIERYIDETSHGERIYNIDVCEHCLSPLTEYYVADYDGVCDSCTPLEHECPYCGEEIQ